MGIKNQNNNLILYFYINNAAKTCTDEVTNTFYKEFTNIVINSDNFSCHYKDVVFCFYENNSNDLVVSLFNVDITNQNIEYSSSYSKHIEGSKLIKSIISYDNTIFYVCYIDNEKSNNCLIFYINTNEWSEPINNLNNCLINSYSFTLQYFDSLNYYILSCLQSQSEFSFLKLNNNFETIDDNTKGFYYISESLINSCTQYSLASLVNDTDYNIIKMFGICDTTVNKYEIQKYISPTTIITNIPTTIITNTPTTIITNTPTTIITNTPTTIITYTTHLPITSLDINTNEYTIIQETTLKNKEEIVNNNNKMEDYDIGKIYEIFGNDYNIKISPINTKQYKNISTYIDFSKCENILRKKNGLSSSDILTTYQIEIDNPNEQMLINNIEYAVFDENKNKLDLSVCENEIIEINYKINTSMINMTKVQYYAEKGINVFDIKDEFFNDICYPYSEDDSDMILKDRRKDIYENYSICENNCEFDRINTTSNIVTCKCNVKTKMNSNIISPTLDQVVIDTFKDSNIAVIICYKLVFNFKNKLKNIGFCIFTILILAHIPIIIHYSIFNINSIKKFIFLEMNKFGYWQQIVNPLKKTINKNKLNKNRITEKEKVHNKKSRETKNKMKKPPKFKGSKQIFITSFRKSMESNSVFNSNRTLNELKKKNNKYQNTKQKNVSVINYNLVNKNEFKFVAKNLISVYNSSKCNTINNNKNNKQKKYKPSPKSYSLIQIDANNSFNNIPVESYIILDNYDYETSIKYDKRSFCRIFIICLLAKENFINIIFFRTPLDLQALRICLFIFINACDLAFNSIFYSNENISDKYHYQGNNLYFFTIVNNIIQSLFSSIISLIIINLFQHMIESRGNFEDIFQNEEKKMRKNKKYTVSKNTKKKILKDISKIFLKLKRKIIIFLVLEFLMMLFFYYFVTAFCEVYKNTQISWIYDFFVSLLISFVTEIFGALILAIFYIISIRYKIKIIYQVVLFFYNL